jgi:predicted MFS family arabinose efflux permease
MKRSFSFGSARAAGVLTSGTGLIAATYGLVRLAYGLFLPDVQADLAFGSTAAGLISTGASLVYCAGATIGFFTAARHPRRLVAAATVTAGLGAAGMAASQQTAVFSVFAVAASAGAGLASPGLVSIVRRHVAAGADDRGQAIVNAGTGPGLVAAGVLALVLLPDWRTAWSVVAVLTLVIGVTVLVLDRPRAPTAADDRAGLPPRSWFRGHRPVVVAALLMGAGSAAIWNFGRTVLVDAGADEATSVTAWIALGIGGAAVIGTARPMSALRPRTAWTVTSLTIAVSSAAFGLAPGSTTVALLACAAFGWGYTAGSGALIAWTTRIDPARASAGTSLLFVVLVLGQAVGATTIGLMSSAAGSGPAFLVAATLAAASTAAALTAAPPQEPEPPLATVTRARPRGGRGTRP